MIHTTTINNVAVATNAGVNAAIAMTATCVANVCVAAVAANINAVNAINMGNVGINNGVLG